MSIDRYIKDIREFEDETNKSYEVANVLELLKGELPESLVDGLQELHSELGDLTYTVLVSIPPDARYVEGRGKYHKRKVLGRIVILYTKGTGSTKALAEEGKVEPFQAFGEVEGNLFFDDIDNQGHYPRIWGAQSHQWGSFETLIAARIFYGLVEGLKLETIDDVLNCEISIPMNLVHLRSLSEHLAQAAEEAVTSSDRWRGHPELYAIGIVVPTHKRTSAITYGTTSSAEHHESIFGKDVPPPSTDTTVADAVAYKIVGKTLRNLVRYAFVITSPASLHHQNFYYSSESVCAQADHSDMLPLESLAPAERHIQVFNTICQLAPFYPNSTNTSGLQDNLGVIQDYLAGLIGDETRAEELTRLWPVFSQEVTIAIADYLLKLADEEHIDKVLKQFQHMGTELDGGESLSNLEALSEHRILVSRNHLRLNYLYISTELTEEDLFDMPAEDILGCRRNIISDTLLECLLEGTPPEGPVFDAARNITDYLIAMEEAQEPPSEGSIKARHAWMFADDLQKAFTALRSDLIGDIVLALDWQLSNPFPLELREGYEGMHYLRYVSGGLSCAIHNLYINRILDHPDFKMIFRPVLKSDPYFATDVFYALADLKRVKDEYRQLVFEELLELIPSNDPDALNSWTNRLEERGLAISNMEYLDLGKQKKQS